MAVQTAGFNPAGATNGATIATTDTGDLTAWTSVSGTPPIYDNTHVLFGKALAGKVSVSAASKFMGWTVSNAANHFGRAYIFFSSLPEAPAGIIFDNAVNALNVRVDASGHVILNKLNDTRGTDLATSTTTLTTGQWYRLEWNLHPTDASGSVSIFTSPDSATAAETISASLISGGAATASTTLYGVSDSNHTTTFWLAQIVDNATASIGPFPVNTVAPGVTGSTAVGSTLTCDGGTWNGTFTIGYQWTSNGSNISGATSSTYVTQAGDAGNAIGCKVTATGQQATNESATQVSGNTVTVTSGASAPSNTVAPAVTGTATVGSTLTTDNGTWSQTGTPAYTYQWQDCATSNGTFANIASATSSTYTIASGEATKYIKCVVTDTDVNGATSASSNVVGPVAAAATSGSASGGVNFPTSLLVNQSI